MSWEKSWQQGRTGWDAGAAAPSLVHLLDAGALARVERTLVPGCGAGYDAFELARASAHVVGLDLAPTSAVRFEAERDARGLSSAQVSAHTGDFFSYEPAEPFGRVWDYTFLCALPLAMRPAWASKMASLLAPGAELITLIFPMAWVRGEDRSSPPFRLMPDEVSELLSADFDNVAMEPVPQDRSHDGRAGLETLALWRRR